MVLDGMRGRNGGFSVGRRQREKDAAEKRGGDGGVG